MFLGPEISMQLLSFPRTFTGGALFGLGLPTLCFAFTSLQAGRPPGLPPEWREILSHMSIVYIDDGHGNPLKTIEISEVNVRIVNGSRATSGDPSHPISDPGNPNGLGNLIIGYNELRDTPTNDRTGSHNLVVGTQNNYLKYGGIVFGSRNSSEAAYACVTGGSDNTAGGPFTTVSGGYLNQALLANASVSGGAFNTAIGGSASVSGGSFNTASGETASVSGGLANTACEINSSVSGGQDNAASGWYSSVSGGLSNTASGRGASVSGGLNRSALGDRDWRAGSLMENDP
jgi:hypothetical protein